MMSHRGFDSYNSGKVKAEVKVVTSWSIYINASSLSNMSERHTRHNQEFILAQVRDMSTLIFTAVISTNSTITVVHGKHFQCLEPVLMRFTEFVLLIQFIVLNYQTHVALPTIAFSLILVKIIVRQDAMA